MPLLWRPLGLFSIPLNRQPDPLSQFFGVFFFARQMLDTSSIYQDHFAINTSSIPIDLSRFCSRQVLDTFSIYRATFYIYIYIYLRSDPVLLKIKYLDLSLFSLDPNLIFSPKSFSHSRFRPNPSLNPLVSVLYLSLACNMLMHCTQFFSSSFLCLMFLLCSLFLFSLSLSCYSSSHGT